MATDPAVLGWLTLGSLATATGQQGIGWSNGVVRWRERNAGHPAMSVLDGLDIPEDQLLDYPRRIALLLPLSGRTASAGQAVQNGFLGAYFASAGGLDDRQSIRVYDVEAEGGPSAAYTSARGRRRPNSWSGPLFARPRERNSSNDILVPRARPYAQLLAGRIAAATRLVPVSRSLRKMKPSRPQRVRSPTVIARRSPWYRTSNWGAGC